ncbi:MAG: HPF/RaiA family ribosome-associated protein [Thiotrichales bacterium]
MKINYTYRNFREASHEATVRFVEEQVNKHLEPKLSHFNPDLLRLHLTLEQFKYQYRVTARLQVPPKKVIVTHAEDEHLPPAIEKVLDQLSRRLEKHQAQVSGREQWKRKSRRQEIRKLKQDVGAAAVETVPDYETRLKQLMSRLQAYIKHELTYLRLNGELPGDYPTVTDIADEAYLKVLKEAPVEADDERLYQMLLKAVSRILNRELTASEQEKNTVSVEGSIEKDALDQSEEMVEEEIQEFYQPDEVLHLEDLIPDRQAETPEEETIQEATEQVYRLLADLPYLWRQVVTLVYREGIEPEVVADAILDIGVDQVNDILRYAESFLHAHLTHQGLVQIGSISTLLKQ